MCSHFSIPHKTVMEWLIIKISPRLVCQPFWQYAPHPLFMLINISLQHYSWYILYILQKTNTHKSIKYKLLT